MELFITLVIIIVLLLILGVDIFLIIRGILWLMEIILLGMTLLFLLCVIVLLLGKWKDAQFMHIEKEQSWGHAFYRVEGEVRKNLFPAEIILQKQIYRKTDVRVRFWSRGKLYVLFDRYSILIATLGFPLSAIGAVLLGLFLLSL